MHELGGAAYHSGLQTRGYPGRLGRLSPEQIRASMVSDSIFHTPRTSVVAIENTHNTAGGTVWPLDELHAVVATCRELGLWMHLDGARLLNAAVALGVPAGGDRRAVRHRHDLPLEGARLPARRPDRRLAGADAPRAGREAPLRRRDAAGRHRRGGRASTRSTTTSSGSPTTTSARAASPWPGQQRGLPVELERVQTNFVQVDVAALGLGEHEAVDRLTEAGVLLSRTMRAGVLRAVTHLDVDDETSTRAIELVPRALGVVVARA